MLPYVCITTDTPPQFEPDILKCNVTPKWWLKKKSPFPTHTHTRTQHTNLLAKANVSWLSSDHRGRPEIFQLPAQPRLNRVWGAVCVCVCETAEVRLWVVDDVVVQGLSFSIDLKIDLKMSTTFGIPTHRSLVAYI